jgi:hypothetical protein
MGFTGRADVVPDMNLGTEARSSPVASISAGITALTLGDPVASIIFTIRVAEPLDRTSSV